MSRIAAAAQPVLDDRFAHSIAACVRQVPAYLLVELAIGENRERAAETIGELIVAEMTMQYPEQVERAGALSAF